MIYLGRPSLVTRLKMNVRWLTDGRFMLMRWTNEKENGLAAVDSSYCFAAG